MKFIKLLICLGLITSFVSLPTSRVFAACQSTCITNVHGTIPAGDLSLMEQAATAYWVGHHPRQFAVATCQPSMLKVVYVSDSNTNRIGRDPRLGGALKSAKTNDPGDYCKVDINSTFLDGTNVNLGCEYGTSCGYPKWRICYMIVHEYGHLLNYRHSNENSSGGNDVSASAIAKWGNSVMFSEALSDKIDEPKTICPLDFPINEGYGFVH